jgi:hypothetical protein
MPTIAVDKAELFRVLGQEYDISFILKFLSDRAYGFLDTLLKSSRNSALISVLNLTKILLISNAQLSMASKSQHNSRLKSLRIVMICSASRA